jgi:hypothetical protein
MTGELIFAGVIVAFVAIGFGTLLLTGGLRTRQGGTIGRQRTQQQLGEMVARVKEREARRKKAS